MRTTRLRPTLLFAAAVLTAGCGGPSQETNTAVDRSIPFRADGSLTFFQEDEAVVEIEIEVADTDSLRNRGLMQRTSLPEKTGMIFVFDQPGMQGFYMANTLISLDFFFVGADSVIVNTVKYASPLSLDTIASSGPSLWVVEVEAGFIDTYGLVAGDRVSWQRNP
jgi:uncharacterized protein